jgi:hypothetical protein
MTTLLTILFVSTLATAPVATLETGNNTQISYVCYIENGNLMLAELQKGNNEIKTKITDTGISTNDLEKVTMNLQNNNVCLSVEYSGNEPLNAYFNCTSLEFSQIQLSEPALFAELSADGK